ncbi:MAG: hypothetical protein RSB54_02585, partial [Bacilli bacterium]
GQTYPEMDKLLSMCKIFKCSLDDLTNDEITSVKIDEKGKNNINNLIDGTLDLIKRTHDMIIQMKALDMVKCIIVMIMVGLILLVFNIPFIMIERAFYTIISNTNFPGITNFLSGIFNLVVDACYYILYVLIFIYIFKISYLDKWTIQENNLTIKTDDEKTNNEIKTIDKKSHQVNPHTYEIFNILGKIAMLFIKIMTVCFSIPFIISLFLLSAVLLISVILLFKGVVYLGILFGILFSVLLNLLIIEVIFNFITNNKNNAKRLLITFVISISGLGLSFGIFMLDIANTTYINTAPSSEKVKTISSEIKMTDELMLDNYQSYEYYVDDSLIDKVKVEVTYYEKYANVNFNTDKFITIYNRSSNRTVNKNFLSLVIKDLRKKEIHDYNKLEKLVVKVYSSSENIKKLKDRRIKFNEEYEKNQKDTIINDYENKIIKYENEINNLKGENESLQRKTEELKNKINEYKDKLKTLIE